MTETEALNEAILLSRRIAEQPELVARRRKAIKALVGHGWSYQQIADAIGTTKSNVAYIILRSKP